MMKSKPTAVDLFCGAGGMTLGFEQAGFDVRAAFDFEEFNVRTHSANFPSSKAVTVDLARETGDSLRQLAGIGAEEVDVVFGGPPCQGFSFGGRHNVADERNLLIHDFARLVRQLRPKYFVMENVKGLMTARSKPILDSYLYRVKLAGYRVVLPIQVLNAADFGVPQRRWRTFVLGYRKDVAAPKYPNRMGCREIDGNEFFPLVRDAFSDLPIIEDYDSLFETDEFPGTQPPATNSYARIMRGIVSDPDDRSQRSSVSTRLTGCLRTKHSKQTVSRFLNTKPGSSEPVSRYIRLSLDDVAPTIRAGTGSDHGSHTAPRPIHPSLPRCITAREAARVHSLPDWFRLHPTRWHAFRQIGNSVPPFLARAVAAEVAAICQ